MYTSTVILLWHSLKQIVILLWHALKQPASLLANALDGVSVNDPHDHFAFVHWTNVRVVLGKLASQRDESVDLCANKPMSQ
jgi:hypothetical protein